MIMSYSRNSVEEKVEGRLEVVEGVLIVDTVMTPWRMIP
jgi:hypothetical protein